MEDQTVRPPYAPRYPSTGTSIHSEITPAEDQTVGPPYAPKHPSTGTFIHSEITPAEDQTVHPPYVPSTGTSTHSGTFPAEDQAENLSPPPSPHTPPTPQTAFLTEPPPNEAENRRRCASLRKVFKNPDMTDQERHTANFCCKLCIGACVVGIGTGVAIGGAVSWMYALQDLQSAQDKKKKPADPPMATEVKRRRRQSLPGRRERLGKRAGPLRGMSRLETGPGYQTATLAEGERRRVLLKLHSPRHRSPPARSESLNPRTLRGRAASYQVPMPAFFS